jgi:hypothetical protein
VTLDEECSRAGWTNSATYLYHQRIKARREAEQAARQRQAQHMADRREKMQGIGSGSSDCRPVPKPNF